MALKFLNKKGWHTGSLRNIENVWKAEQKHEAEEKKLDELRKQIQEERERSEFRQLQEQAGLVPRQERLEFLYDGGLSVGKGNASTSSGAGVAFKELEQAVSGGGTKASESAPPTSSSAAATGAPGALFEDKPQSANDAWRKLHSDPLLMIRQREQEALARIKNNPVQMALIRKSVQGNGEKEKKGGDRKDHKKKHRRSDKHSSSSKRLSDSEDDGRNGERNRSSHKHRSSKYHDHSASDSEDNGRNRDRKRSSNKHKSSKHHDHPAASDDESSGRDNRKRKDTSRGFRDRSPGRFSEKADATTHRDRPERDHERPKNDKRYSDGLPGREAGPYRTSDSAVNQDSYRRRRNAPPKLTEEERAARLREMQLDAEIHEEQRWKRLKKADEADVREDSQAKQTLGGKNFLDAAQKSIYGAEKGGSSTIEESVRRRAYYSQRSEMGGNAFRR